MQPGRSENRMAMGKYQHAPNATWKSWNAQSIQRVQFIYIDFHAIILIRLLFIDFVNDDSVPRFRCFADFCVWKKLNSQNYE